MRLVLTVTVIAAAALLSSCAHKDLKAPCADDDAPSAVAAYTVGDKKLDTSAFGKLTNDCGPLQPIHNES